MQPAPAVAPDRHVQHHPAALCGAPLQDRFHGAVDLPPVNLGQEAEAAQVDSHQRRSLPADEPRHGEKGSVSTDDHHGIGSAGDLGPWQAVIHPGQTRRLDIQDGMHTVSLENIQCLPEGSACQRAGGLGGDADGAEDRGTRCHEPSPSTAASREVSENPGATTAERLRWRSKKNSRFPSAPRIGEAESPQVVQPVARASRSTFLSTPA